MPQIDWSTAGSGFALPSKVGMHYRNDTMHRYLSSLRGKGARDDQIEQAALSANAANFEPPLDMDELRRIVRSVCSYDVGDGTYHGEPAPKAIPSDNIPTIDRFVPIDVLPDLSGMAPNEQARAYLRACFDDEDTVCLSRNLMSGGDDGYEYVGVLLGGAGYEALDRYLPHVEEVGMWCCVNPLLPDTYKRDKTAVAAYRNLLVECDDLPMDQQLQLMLNLFWGRRGILRAITDSGGKSYHCIIRVNARDAETYQMDAKFIFDMCDHNGLAVDRKCKNPTRMTRFPGAMRGGRMQRLVWAYGV